MGARMGLRSHARAVVGNAGLNLATQVGLILVYLATTPVIVHGLGEAAYGLLSLILVVLGFYGSLDL